MNFEERLVKVKEIAKSNGGKCLSKTYLNNREFLIFQCKKGHKWETNFKTINKGSWFPDCSKTRLNAEKSILYYKELCNLAKAMGGRCISRKYVGAHSKLLWECRIGHQWLASPNSIKNGSWCPVCSSGYSERICKKAFELMFDKPFKKCKPSWLIYNKRMELDGYNEELGIAFEHNGIQHYEKTFPNISLVDIHKRDKHKIKLCYEQNVKLIIIPALFVKTPLDGLIEFIECKCKEFNIDIPNKISTSNLNIKNIKTFSYLDLMNELQLKVKQQGGKCLSAHYSSKQMKFKCSCGFIWKTKPISVKSGSWCPRCANKIPITIEQVKKIC